MSTLMLGDEAVALGALHAGISAAYGYPGTPSTEIMEALLGAAEKGPFQGKFKASWCANEKTALEAALGASVVGRRVLVTMKHVGLNVAADPFMSSALVSVAGGLVIAVADDPGMHSSQNEQDTRFLADFARVICLEPADPQEAYDMTQAAFDLSEKYHQPVILRLVTRLSHGRGVVNAKESSAFHPQNELKKGHQPNEWILMPSNARKQWKMRLNQQEALRVESAHSPFNELFVGSKEVGIITTGTAKNYFLEIREELSKKLAASSKDGLEPSWLHIGQYPLPRSQIEEFIQGQGAGQTLNHIFIIEEGYPFVERALRGISPKVSILGKDRIDPACPPILPEDGELNPDLLKQAFGLKAISVRSVSHPLHVLDSLPGRPPQLCQGCPHSDSFGFVKAALADFTAKTKHPSLVTSDIGCYTLGAMPEYGAIETCVCMGASIAMAKGAAEAGLKPVVAMIGDGTFLHSGIPPLLDAASANTPMTVIIMDNQTVAMTGGQTPVVPSGRLKELVLGLGVNEAHVHVVEAHRKSHSQNVELLKKELDYSGLSVVIAVRECIETAKKHKAGAQ